jgi:hypothetical protein
MILSQTAEQDIKKALVDMFKVLELNDEDLKVWIDYCNELLESSKESTEELVNEICALLISSVPDSEKLGDCANLQVVADMLTVENKDALYDFQQKCIHLKG